MAATKKITGKPLSASQLSKKYSSAGVARSITLPADDAIWLPSRIMPINYILGGGIPYGKILEIFGQESSGKTLLAIDFAYVTQKLGGIVLWNDAEQAFDPYWMEQNGIDLDRVILCNYTSVEMVSDWIADNVLHWRSQLVNNEPILFVDDSLAALDCDANIDSEQSNAKAEMGNRAKAIYKMLRIRNEFLFTMGVCSIFINQLRQKVGASPYEDPDTTPGGGAMKFFASQRLGCFGSKQIKAKINGQEDRVGRLCSVRVKKNKVAPPRPTIKTEVFFNADYAHVEPIGFSKYKGLPEILERVGTLTRKKGSSYYKFGEEVVANGEPALLKLLKTDSAKRKAILKASGINTLMRTKRQIAKISTNRFPVKGVKIESQKDE